MWPRENLTTPSWRSEYFLFVCEVLWPNKALKVMLCQSFNLSTLICTKRLCFTTALLELAIGKEWLEKLFHEKIRTKPPLPPWKFIDCPILFGDIWNLYKLRDVWYLAILGYGISTINIFGYWQYQFLDIHVCDISRASISISFGVCWVCVCGGGGWRGWTFFARKEEWAALGSWTCFFYCGLNLVGRKSSMYFYSIYSTG